MGMYLCNLLFVRIRQFKIWFSFAMQTCLQTAQSKIKLRKIIILIGSPVIHWLQRRGRGFNSSSDLPNWSRSKVILWADWRFSGEADTQASGLASFWGGPPLCWCWKWVSKTEGHSGRSKSCTVNWKRLGHKALFTGSYKTSGLVLKMIDCTCGWCKFYFVFAEQCCNCSADGRLWHIQL